MTRHARAPKVHHARVAKPKKVHKVSAKHARKVTKHARKASHIRRHTTAHARHNSSASI